MHTHAPGSTRHPDHVLSPHPFSLCFLPHPTQMTSQPSVKSSGPDGPDAQTPRDAADQKVKRGMCCARDADSLPPPRRPLPCSQPWPHCAAVAASPRGGQPLGPTHTPGQVPAVSFLGTWPTLLLCSCPVPCTTDRSSFQTLRRPQPAPALAPKCAGIAGHGSYCLTFLSSCPSGHCHVARLGSRDA